MRLGLLPSPLLGPGSWGPTAAVLRAQGHDVVAVEVDDDGGRSPVSTYAHGAAAQLVGAPVVLVAHSGAGPLVPVVAARRERGGVVGAVMVDASLPGLPGESRLAALRRLDPSLAREVARDLYAGGLAPQWPPESLTVLAAHGVVLRPRGLAWFAEPLPVPQTGWAELPWAYVATSPAYAAAAATAESQARPVLHRDLGHLAPLTDPEPLAADVLALAALL